MNTGKLGNENTSPTSSADMQNTILTGIVSAQSILGMRKPHLCKQQHEGPEEPAETGRQRCLRR